MSEPWKGLMPPGRELCTGLVCVPLVLLDMEGRRRRRRCVLSAARPYMLIFSVFALTPPPNFFDRTTNQRLRRYSIVGYGFYSLFILGILICMSYVSVLALNEEIEQYRLEDFTRAMGRVQKIVLIIMGIVNQLNMLLNYRRLGHIYEDMADLEMEIDDASQCFGGQPGRNSFRYRLAISCGLWLVLLVGLMPRMTLQAMGPWVTFPNNILSELILIMLQLKCLEYCVFVVMVYELVLRLRHTLRQLQSELADCNQSDMLQALCVALRRNQQLLGRVWRLVGELERYFTLPMMFLFLFNGVTILHVLNWAYINQFNPDDCCRYVRIGNCLLLLINPLVACFLSQRCINAYNSFPRTLHRMRCLSVANNFPILSMGLREYCLQLQHLRLLFTCGGFFDINLQNFGGLVVTILGYTIILVQFKFQAVAEENVRNGSKSSAP
ncbi:putative gustatory receptor 98b [Drosophila obscura]|uniref:putative gustatory receptor 98b n=1 Tax=Drosophila obscura TaxID=7282 RepID=UPI001BB205BD|nr:putative gustatory receptor 98b [Drosophila obscura]